MDLTTFHNVSTVAITDQADLHVNCLSEAPLTAGQHGLHGRQSCSVFDSF